MEKSIRKMNKFFSILIASIVAISPVLAQNTITPTRKQEARAQKEAQKEAKQQQKEKFELLELGDLEMALEDFFLERNVYKKKQLVGTAIASDRAALDFARMEALNNAMNEYAMSAASMAKGRIVTNASRIGEDKTNDIVSAFERLVVGELKGEISPNITLIKKDKKGEIQVRVYCLLDLDAAHSARMRAMQNALEELQLSQEYGSEVSSWIDEGLNK